MLDYFISKKKNTTFFLLSSRYPRPDIYGSRARVRNADPAVRVNAAAQGIIVFYMLPNPHKITIVLFFFFFISLSRLTVRHHHLCGGYWYRAGLGCSSVAGISTASGGGCDACGGEDTGSEASSKTASCWTGCCGGGAA